jgi:uncharacterized protein (DUF58 family)
MHPAQRSVKSTVPGNHHSPFRGQGLEFDSVREYVPGDDIRNIDWRVTARTGAAHLKIFKEDRERRIVLCVDMNSSMRFGTRCTFKSVQAARTAALLGWQGLARHDSVSACLFGDVPEKIQLFAAKRTHHSFCSMLKMMADPFAGRHAVSINDALQHIGKASHTGSLIYLISDFMDLDKNIQHEAVLSRLNKRCDVVFIAINDQADRSIYPIGNIRFCADGAEKTYINTESIAGREAYAALWNANRRRLYEISSKFKIPLIELTTESDIHRDLMMGLKSIAKRKGR